MKKDLEKILRDFADIGGSFDLDQATEAIMKLVESKVVEKIDSNNLTEIIAVSKKYMPNDNDNYKMIKLDPETWNAYRQAMLDNLGIKEQLDERQ